MERLLRTPLWALDLLVVVVCSIFLARGAATLIGRAMDDGLVPPRVPPRASVNRAPPVADKETQGIVERNIICSTCMPAAEPLAPPPDASPRRTVLPLQLLAIMFAPEPAGLRWSVAIIRDKDDQVAGAFATGMRIRDATIARIRETRVELQRAGRTEYVDLLVERPVVTPGRSSAQRSTSDPFLTALQEGIMKTGDLRYEVRRATVDSLFANTNVLARSVRIVPEVRDGRAVGFRLLGVRPDGPFAMLGLQDGDLVSAVNGLEMTSPDTALDVYVKLKSARHLSVGIERSGRRITTEYSIR